MQTPRPEVHRGEVPDLSLHESDHVIDHLVVMIHVGAISIQRSISVKSHQPQFLYRGMHLHVA